MKPGDSQAKSPQEKLFQARLDQQLNPNQPLFRLGRQIDWGYFNAARIYTQEKNDSPTLYSLHEKQDHRLGRDYLEDKEGDSINALLSGRGFNLRKFIRASLAPCETGSQGLFSSR